MKNLIQSNNIIFLITYTVMCNTCIVPLFFTFLFEINIIEIDDENTHVYWLIEIDCKHFKSDLLFS